MQNSEKIWTYSSSRSSKVIHLGANRKHKCNFLLVISKGKGKGKGSYLNSISQLQSVTCHIGSHSVTCHPTQVSTPRQAALTPAIQAGTRFTYPGGMEGWVDLGDLLHTEMVYSPAGGHPSKY